MRDAFNITGHGDICIYHTNVYSQAETRLQNRFPLGKGKEARQNISSALLAGGVSSDCSAQVNTSVHCRTPKIMGTPHLSQRLVQLDLVGGHLEEGRDLLFPGSRLVFVALELGGLNLSPFLA